MCLRMILKSDGLGGTIPNFSLKTENFLPSFILSGVLGISNRNWILLPVTATTLLYGHSDSKMYIAYNLAVFSQRAQVGLNADLLKM